MKRMERRSHAHAMDESPVWRISHGQATCQRRTLATHRTALASTQASSLPVPRRKPLDYRKVLTGIIFVLKTGIPWEELPQEMGCGCGMTCLNYLNAWQRAGVWEKLHQILLAELEQADKLDWSRAAVDSAKARALGGGDQTGPNPTDRGKPGTKHHVLTEGQGVPLVTHSTGANVPDVNELLPLVDDIPPVRRKADRPRRVPDNLYADRAYDSQPHRQELERGGLIPTWRGVGPNTAVAWGSIAGWRSGPCRGCTAFAGSGCGPIERVRSMMPSSRWLQLSYVCGSYDKVFLLVL